MAKRNWSNSEANNWRKTKANKYAGKHYRQSASSVAVTVDPVRVQESFASKADPNGKQFYQPPIVGKSICR